jgi:hypothetical protein
MKQQIARFSPHQNGKVFAVLTALTSLIFLVPFVLLFSAFAPPTPGAPPMVMMLLLPVFYLIFGYISVVIGCALYNLTYKLVGGIEFESKADAA